MKKLVDLESTVERLSILRGYLLDSARLQEEAGNKELAAHTRSEARGVELAMQSIKREWEENVRNSLG